MGVVFLTNLNKTVFSFLLHNLKQKNLVAPLKFSISGNTLLLEVSQIQKGKPA